MSQVDECSRRDVVVLVDAQGEPAGLAGKADAHRPPGQLHLAFSVVLYRDDGHLLLQQRAGDKYHFPLFWANACCSHPGPGEVLVSSAERRVQEELGCHAELEEVGSFTYRARCPLSGLIEHELDHVLIGTLTETPRPDADEVAALKWVSPSEVFSGKLEAKLTPWLIPALEIAEAWRAEHPARAHR